MLTVEDLKNSPQYKEWVTGKMVLIHNTYWDSKEPYEAYIVLHMDMGKVTITRFFMGGNKIQVSNDHIDISVEETFEILLSQYSSGLK